MEMLKACRQWANRPADERFSSLEEMRGTCAKYRSGSASTYVKPKLFRFRVDTLNAESRTADLLVDMGGITTKFSYWGFGQLAVICSAPASYLRRLPLSLVVSCLTHGLAQIPDYDLQALIYSQDGDHLCRSLNSETYARIWNSEVCDKLLLFQNEGWRIPPARPAFPGQLGSRPATLDDVLHDDNFSLSVKVGDLIAPAGLYASDHDMFAFMVDPTRQISDGSGEPLFRGFFVWNSEVGSSVFGLQSFLYRHVCGNHIVWGATNIKTIKIRHVGAANYLFRRELYEDLDKYRNSSTVDDEEKIKAAQIKQLGHTKEAVVETLLSKRIKLGRRLLEDAFDDAELNSDEDGDPRTVWGMVNGLTRISQLSNYTDERMKIDLVSQQILSLV